MAAILAAVVISILVPLIAVLIAVLTPVVALLIVVVAILTAVVALFAFILSLVLLAMVVIVQILYWLALPITWIPITFLIWNACGGSFDFNFNPDRTGPIFNNDYMFCEVEDVVHKLFFPINWTGYKYD